MTTARQVLHGALFGLLASAAACARPVVSTPPPARLDAPVAVSVVEAELPYLPPVPELSGVAHPPLDGRLPVRAERTADVAGAAVTGEPDRLVLVLAPCRFESAEPTVEGAVPTDDCRAYNRTTSGSRTHDALVVPPGRYVISVRNDAFDRALGLWLRSADQPGSAIVSAGGVAFGTERSWDVTLTEGTYLYSCPLSPTPTYVLIVR